MEILVTARKFELDDSLREHVHRRLGRLERFNSKLARVEVALTDEKHGRQVEALAVLDRDVDLHAEAIAEDFRTAINKVSDRLMRQLKRRHQLNSDHQAPRLGRDIEPNETVEAE